MNRYQLYLEALRLRDLVLSVSVVSEPDPDTGMIYTNHGLLRRLEARIDRRCDAWTTEVAA